jgi:hypothetical protein
VTDTPCTTDLLLLCTWSSVVKSAPGLTEMKESLPAVRSTPSTTCTSTVFFTGSIPSAVSVTVSLPVLPRAALAAVRSTKKSPTAPYDPTSSPYGCEQVTLVGLSTVQLSYGRELGLGDSRATPARPSPSWKVTFTWVSVTSCSAKKYGTTPVLPPAATVASGTITAICGAAA